MAGSTDRVANESNDLRRRIEQPDGIRRLGQALWMMVGEQITPGSLVWSRALLGREGDSLLWKELCAHGVLTAPDFVVRPQALASFLGGLWADGTPTTKDGSLVWTLPKQLAVDGIASDGYVRTAVEIIESAARELIVVAPYLEPRGMGWLHSGLVGSLERGVSVTILTHYVDDASSMASASLEELRRECANARGLLSVFTASPMVRDLLHLKAIAADDRRGLIGSANVTGKGFGANLEAGVVIGPDAAHEVGRIVQAAILGGLVRVVYTNQQASGADSLRCS